MLFPNSWCSRSRAYGLVCKLPGNLGAVSRVSPKVAFVFMQGKFCTIRNELRIILSVARVSAASISHHT